MSPETLELISAWAYYALPGIVILAAVVLGILAYGDTRQRRGHDIGWLEGNCHARRQRRVVTQLRATNGRFAKKEKANVSS
jgi:hypothetical protein